MDHELEDVRRSLTEQRKGSTQRAWSRWWGSSDDRARSGGAGLRLCGAGGHAKRLRRIERAGGPLARAWPFAGRRVLVRWSTAAAREGPVLRRDGPMLTGQAARQRPGRAHVRSRRRLRPVELTLSERALFLEDCRLGGDKRLARPVLDDKE